MNFLFLLRRLSLRAVSVIAFVLGSNYLCCAEVTPLRIPRVSRPPVLADFANGSPREAEAAFTVFLQADPHDGAPVSQPTAAYLSYDDKNLYIGWICKDDPAKIRAWVSPRKLITTDDRVTINIDTFNDHKHAYWFDVNPFGIQYDGRTTDGVGDDPTWEAFWYSEGRITADGYVVLETIPFRSLRFPRGPRQIWNICLGRQIQRNNEFSTWPHITDGLPQYVGQFAPIEIDEDISPGRNVQLIPYGLYSHDNHLDENSGFEIEQQHHLGLDAKMVLHDALTLDVTVNPDFSEIGSDDPKVEVNQRFQVTYPERRPFFLENASIFSLPETFFYSRNIVDPQFGAKLTGSLGRWSLGALATDDRAQGETLAPGESGDEQRAFAGVFRVEREFGHQSHAGLFLSDTNYQSTGNRVGSLDLRYLLPHNWIVVGEATATQTRLSSTSTTGGPGYAFYLMKSDPHAYFGSYYTDRSAAMTATLGYLNRSDIRQWEIYDNYYWKPAKGRKLLSFGPSLDTLINYDHEHRLENWYVIPGFSITLPRLTSLSATYNEAYELYNGIGFREWLASGTVATSWYKWLQLSSNYSQGMQPNYYPATHVLSFIGRANNASTTLTLRPGVKLRLDEIYYYTRLATGPKGPPAPNLPNGVVFTDHLLRSKVNYQFNRDYAFNAIFDYYSLLPNAALVSSPYAKQADTTLLFSYLPHPGTALYLGYSNIFQNVDFNAANNPPTIATVLPATSTDRQIFVKFSYLLRF